LATPHQRTGFPSRTGAWMAPGWWLLAEMRTTAEEKPAET